MKTDKQFLSVSPTGYGASDRFVFSYHCDRALPAGTLVKVPLRSRQVWGVVAGPAKTPKFKTRPISSVAAFKPLPSELVALAQWLADYYAASAAAVWQTILPPRLDKPPQRESAAYMLPEINWDTRPLSPDQQQALRSAASASKPVLLHGVTGSGKTQVYIELAKQAAASGRSVMILVPEIALTPQVLARFYQVFGDLVVSRHSRMTPAQKFFSWQKVLNAKGPQIIIGPRSCLFLPATNLGLIVIDECHETTYKSEQSPRYQADSVAAKLASLHGAKLVLGSATPSLTQLFLSNQGRLQLVPLKRRADGGRLPIGTIVDLRRKDQGGSRFISAELKDALSNSLRTGRQSLLFINRRGSATSHLCASCGYVSVCPSCHLPLTFHADRLGLLCHHCAHHAPPPSICPECSESDFRFLGGGTQRIEAEVRALFPGIRLLRLDKDTATPKFLHQVHQDLHSGQADILIGTQMVAKGLNLPMMDTIGIIQADSVLHLPDYTAAERTFQLICQVSGRTGRDGDPGRVIIQTYSPDHPAIQAAAKANFDDFTRQELGQRQLLGYPPFIYLLKLSISASSAVAAERAGRSLANKLQRPDLEILGPAPAMRERRAGKYYWQLILKARQRNSLSQIAREIPSSWTIDLDPVNLL